MAQSKQELETLIEQITQQVQKRLGPDGVGLNVVASSSPGGLCMATKETCTGSGQCASRKEPVVRDMISRGAVRFTTAPGSGPVSADLAKYIDHTLLNADATTADLDRVCSEARRYSFASVCVNATNIPYVARCLAGTDVMPIAVVGFPLGAETRSSKAFEAKDAVSKGAQEIDMVINIGALKSKNYDDVLADIKAVVDASKPAPVKVIIEAALLTDDEKIAACALSKAAGAAFVKTSTGFGPGGATPEDVSLMRAVVGPDMGVKASGGVRSTADAQRMIEAGANRIGASASVEIVTGRQQPKKVSAVPGQKQY